MVFKSQSKSYNLRAICSQVVFDVLDKGVSLSNALVQCTNKVNDKDRALVQEICFGIMRVLY